jgi:hypothetical protein
VSAKVVEFAKMPLVPVFVPVTVMGLVLVYVGGGPVVVELLYAEVSVSVALPNVEMVLVDQLAVTPVGNPLTVSITVPVNP